MKDRLKKHFEDILRTELDFQSKIPGFRGDKLSKYRNISHNSFYPLAGCAAHLRAPITEIAQPQHPHKISPGGIVSIPPLPPVLMENLHEALQSRC